MGATPAWPWAPPDTLCCTKHAGTPSSPAALDIWMLPSPMHRACKRMAADVPAPPSVGYRLFCCITMHWCLLAWTSPALWHTALPHSWGRAGKQKSEGEGAKSLAAIATTKGMGGKQWQHRACRPSVGQP